MQRRTITFALALSLPCLAAVDSHAAPPAAFGADAARPASASAAMAMPPATAPWSRDVRGSTVGVVLYASAPLAARSDFLAARGTKRLHILLRQRMSSEQVGRMLIRDVERVSGRALVLPHVNTLAKLGLALGSRSPGSGNESVSLEFVPDLGTRVLIDNTPATDFLGDAAFFAVLVRPWLEAEATAAADLARR